MAGWGWIDGSLAAPGILYGRALLDYHAGDRSGEILLHHDLGTQPVPVHLFYREPSEFSDLERIAMDLAAACGRVLDIGAGVGPHTLYLQDRGCSVTSLEPVPAAAQILRARGASMVVESDLESFVSGDFVSEAFVSEAFGSEDLFDGALLLMNGSMIAGTLSGLRGLLGGIASLLRPGGICLIDSVDPFPFQDKGFDEPGFEELESTPAEADTADLPYPGELHYQLEYGGERSLIYPQLFVDADRLSSYAAEFGLEGAVELRDEEGAYLMKLTHV